MTLRTAWCLGLPAEWAFDFTTQTLIHRTIQPRVTGQPEVIPGQKSASGKSAADYRGDSFRATDKPEAILKLALMVQHPRRFSRGTVKTSRRTLPVLSVREG